MPRVEVTAKAGCIYDSLPRQVGEVFACDLNHARMLKLIGKVEFEEPAKPQSQPAQPVRTRRPYRRRDMVAED